MLVYQRVFLLANACYTICKGNRTIWIFAWKPQHQELQILYPELIAPVTASRGRSEMWRTSCSASAHILRWQVDDVFAIDAWYIPSACPNIQIHQYSNAFGISWLHVPLDFLSSNIDPLILMVASTPPCLLPKAGSPHVVGQGTALAQRWSAESFLCNRTWGVWHGDFAKHQKWWFKHQKWSLNHQKWSLNHQKWWCNMI